MTVQTLSTELFKQQTGEGLSLVDFWGEGCPPCKMIAPIIEALAHEQAGSVQVAKVNVYEEAELAAEYDVTSIPTIIIFKDGQELQRFRGLKSKTDLEEALKLATEA
jgi:thioredoxin 1